MTIAIRRRALSLRFRLLAATVVALAAALLLAGFFLASQFREHVQRQFTAALTAQLDQLTASLDFDAAGQPQIDIRTEIDPRWARPYSGNYWQLDRLAGGKLQSGVLRSRSLWDTTLAAPQDALAGGSVHVHEIAGPQDAHLLLVERTLSSDDTGGVQWRLVVAADLRETDAAVAHFNRVLAASLGVLLVLLGVAAVGQVAVGLAPLKKLAQALALVREGDAQRLAGDFPPEVQPLIDDFNGVLDRNAQVVERARTQAGNLAHAVKTPLAVMAQAATAAERRPEGDPDLAALVQEQVAAARRQVDWHLARSRAAAQTTPGARTAVAPVIEGLLRVVGRVHAGRGLAIASDPIAPACSFAGELQDLQEIVGNLLDNACAWAKSEVRIAASADHASRRLHIVVDDDGPGIAAARRDAAMARGARLDESVAGSGLGLAIVHELVALYGGSVILGTAPAGGLRVELVLPSAPPQRAG
ncbi:MAG TPA: sensor histidine kinase [Burkholderiaceae bacterium]|nr:sensor histidine kinase [Burkholderiaceae bacterium]